MSENYKNNQINSTSLYSNVNSLHNFSNQIISNNHDQQHQQHQHHNKTLSIGNTSTDTGISTNTLLSDNGSNQSSPNSDNKNHCSALSCHNEDLGLVTSTLHNNTKSSLSNQGNNSSAGQAAGLITSSSNQVSSSDHTLINSNTFQNTSVLQSYGRTTGWLDGQNTWENNPKFWLKLG